MADVSSPDLIRIPKFFSPCERFNSPVTNRTGQADLGPGAVQSKSIMVLVAARSPLSAYTDNTCFADPAGWPGPRPGQ